MDDPLSHNGGTEILPDERQGLSQKLDSPQDNHETESVVQGSFISFADHTSQSSGRPPIFEEPPDMSVPGNVHLTSDSALGRLIDSNGAIYLLRQMAKDLAERDSQITEMRKRFEEREKRLKSMLYESGVSRSDVERRLASNLRRKASRESCISGRPWSDFSHVPTLDDQLYDAMSGASLAGSEATGTPVSLDTPKAQVQDRYAQETRSRASSRSSNKQGGSSVSSPDNRHRRRTSVLSRWSAGLFGWNAQAKSSGSPKDGGISSEETQMQREASGDADITAKPNRGLALSWQNDKNAAKDKSNSHVSLDSTTLMGMGLLPAAGTPLHFKAIIDAQMSRPSDLDDVTAQGWIVSKQVSKPIAKMAYSLVFERHPIIASSTQTQNTKSLDPIPPNDIPRSLENAKNVHDMRARIRNFSTMKTNDSWLSPVLRDTANAVLPNSSASTFQAAQNSTMELSTFIPEVDQPPTMLPAWNEHTLNEKSPVFTDRYGFKLFDIRSRRREASAEVYESIVYQQDTSVATKAMTLVDQNSMIALPTARHAFDAAQDSTETDAHSADFQDTKDIIVKSIKPVNGSAKSPKPLVPETTLNKSGAIFSTEKVSARLLMLSQLDLYGADKAKQESWDTFLAKTRMDRQKTGRSPEVLDQNEDELLGLASMGTGKMAKERLRELNVLVLSGIPMSYRPKLWAEMTGAYIMKEPAYYEELLSFGKDVDKICVEQIDLDLKRTMPSNVFFAGTGSGVSKLRRVLVAFSRHNTDVGYCQGMNVIAATLLLTHPTEEDAFFVLACIVEKILPPRYFTPDLLTSRADQIVLKRIVQKICPKTHKHLQRLSIDLEAITFGWFLSVFTDCLPAELLFRVWDIFFIEGHHYLFCVAICLIRIHEKAILKCDSPGEVYTLLKELRGIRDISTEDFVRLAEQVKLTMKSKGYDVPSLQKVAVTELIPHEDTHADDIQPV